MHRRRSSSKERARIDPSAVLVIEESPEKQPSLTIQSAVRRSPRFHRLKRRPSFYKKQELHNAKLLGARIAGTSPPAVALKKPVCSAKKPSEANRKMLAPATFLLSQITSPVSKSPGHRQTPDPKNLDSPSRNTRSKATSTPAKFVVESPSTSVSRPGPCVDSTVRTTPRAKARRRLNDFLNEGDGQKKASPVSKITQKASAEEGTDSPSRITRSKLVTSPVKVVVVSPPVFTSPSGSEGNTMKTSPRAKARRCLNDDLKERETKKMTVATELQGSGTLFKSPFKSPSRAPSLATRQSPRLLKKDGASAKEFNVGKGKTNVKAVVVLEKGSLHSKTESRHTPKKVSRGLELSDYKKDKNTEDGSKPSTNLDNDASKHGTEKLQSDSKDNVKANHKESKASIKVENMDVLCKEEKEDPVTSPGQSTENVEPLWIDKIVAGSPNTVPDACESSLIGVKRKRNAAGNNSESTPLPKQKHARRDICTPPSVPASKCTTPESINSWPRKKIRYSTPSPCTSKSLTPSNMSPETNDQPAGRWTSPRTQRQTPPSQSKKRGNATGSGKKRKRRSPGQSSSGKRRRKSSVASKKNSPRARGSLLEMLSPKTSLEERCISPIFGKAALAASGSCKTLNSKGESEISSGSDCKKRQLPLRRGKSPRAKGSTGSINSEGSLDELDKSFSPVFGVDGIVDPTSSSQLGDSLHVNDGKPTGQTMLAIIDQGLDVDTESDPEIDFPKWRSKSSEGSGGFPSDSEMGMPLDDLEEPINRDPEEPSPRRQLRRSSRENCQGSSSAKAQNQGPPDSEQPISESKMDSGNNPRAKKSPFNTRKRSKEISSDSITSKKSLRKERSADKQQVIERASGAKDDVGGAKDDVSDADRSSLPQASMPSKSSLRGAGKKPAEDEENTRPAEPPKKRKKKVTLVTRLSSSLSQQAPSPSRLSMTLKRSSAGKDWSITNSPEMASTLSFESSLAVSRDATFQEIS